MIYLIALIWLAGTCFRIYKQARFFQIEEYMNLRYLRWWLAERERWLPARTAAAWGIGALLAVLMSEGGDLLPGLIMSGAAVIAVIPPDEGEIKKKFNPTSRAKRLLGGAWAAAALALCAGLLLTHDAAPDSVKTLPLIISSGLGLGLYLLAPVWLTAGNILMLPAENVARRRYLRKARKILAAINPKIIGVTGSYGKTTTKTYLSEILNGRYKTYPTPRSYNTVMGICLAVNTDLANDYSIEYFIVEMGAYIRGEIERICELTPPHIGVVIEVGPQHMERFGSLENIALAKYEIIKALPPDGVGVFNWDNPYVRQMYERGYPATRIAVSKNISPEQAAADGPRFVASEIEESLDGLKFKVTDTQTGESQLFNTTLVGDHNIINVLLATAVAVHEGMDLRDVAFRARQLRPAKSRLTRDTTPEGITIINDAYSANPAGVVSALKVLGMHTSGKRLLITPGMVELGDLMESENYKLGELAARYASHIILIGEKRVQPIINGLASADFPSANLQVVETLSDAVAWYKNHLQSGDTVLFLNDLPDVY